MKNISKYRDSFKTRAAIVLLTSFALAGCVRDDLDYGNSAGSNDALLEFSIRVPGNSLPSTRALDGSKESEVVTVDVLAFDGDGDGANFLYHENTGTISGSTFTVTLPISTDPVRFVFLANAVDIIAAEYGTGKITGTHTYKDIRQALIKSSAQWNVGTAYDPLPMWGEGKFPVTGTPLTNDQKQISLVRMLAKIEVVSTAPQFELEEVRLYNPMPRGYLMPHPDRWDGDKDVMQATAPTLLNTWSRLNTYYDYTLSPSEPDFTNRIYTFETPAGNGTQNNGADMTEGNTFMVVGGKYNNGPVSYFRIDIAQTDANDGTCNYLPLLRNHSYRFNIKSIGGDGYSSPEEAAAAKPINGQVELLVENDYDLRYYAWDDQYYLATETDVLHYDGDAGSYKIAVKTDYPERWVAVVSGSPIDPSEPVPGDWLNITKRAGDKQKEKDDLEFNLTANSDGPRTAYIHITAGRLSLVVTVHQRYKFDIWKINITGITYGYVGAFWKADQTGERLIRMVYDQANNINASNPSIIGTWTATVVEGEEWIVLDTEQPSGVVEWNGGSNPTNMNDDDALHQVTGNATTVSGDCDSSNPIYFRIGLKNKWIDQPGYDPDDAPARYGVILLSYNGNNLKTLIFVRQGEEPDYLMRKTDNNGDGTITTQWGGTTAEPRPDAVKWSPYNLTAPDFKSGDSTTDHPIGVGKGVFTNFPSQAGAYFQWAGSTVAYDTYAYPPIGSAATQTQNRSGYWSTLAATNETCPTALGYRRVNDGITTGNNTAGAIAGSEIRQSLYLNPFAGNSSVATANNNSIWGYYADGFFDRRGLTTAPSTNQANSAVENSSMNVAYVGQLFYNPNNFASLFFPAAGRRYSSRLNDTGSIGYYWPSSAYTATTGWHLSFYQSSVLQANDSRYSAFSVRCVRDE